MLLKGIKNRFFLKAILVVSFFIIGFFNVCLSDEDLIEITDEIWSGEKIIEGNYVLKSNQLNISKGTKILFKDNSSITVENGVINASGTMMDPIIITSYSGDKNSYGIIVNNGGGLYLKNVNISKGGFMREEIDPPAVLSWFIHKAHAVYVNFLDSFGAISSMGGSFLVMDNCNIFDNEVGILINGMNRETNHVSVNRCRFFDNEKSVIESENDTFMNFRYNWWEENNFEGSIERGSKKTKKDFRDPILIIPGIMGSWEKDGKLVIDPIMHTFDDLIEAFENEGYVEGVDLFPFPYEWRDSNIDNAVLLKNRINEIKEQTASNRVDIVAHSMGGLLVREYIQSDYYQGEIDQLVTLGTPHNGSPASYPRWESGTFKLNKLDIFGTIGEKIFEQEAEEEGYDDLFDYVQNRPIESVRELLPVYDYLYDKETGEIREYPSGYPDNAFLENLNDSKIIYLAGLEYMNVVGSKGEGSTITGFEVVKSSEEKLWKHGYPDHFDWIVGDKGIRSGDGDETVPLESAKLVDQYATYILTLNSTHNELPTKAQCEVLHFITGNKVCVYRDDIQLPSTFLLFQVFSPIDIFITLEDGRRIGTDPETGEQINEIEGAYYTGNDTNSEFIIIPNYDNQRYEVDAVGTGNGEFSVKTTSLEEDQNGEVVEALLDDWSDEITFGEIKNFQSKIEENAFAEVDNDDEDEEEDEDDDDDEEGESEAEGSNENMLLADNDYEENIFGNKVAVRNEVERNNEAKEGENEIKVAGEAKNKKSFKWGIIESISLIMLTGLTLFAFWKIRSK